MPSERSRLTQPELDPEAPYISPEIVLTETPTRQQMIDVLHAAHGTSYERQRRAREFTYRLFPHSVLAELYRMYTGQQRQYGWAIYCWVFAVFIPAWMVVLFFCWLVGRFVCVRMAMVLRAIGIL